MEPEEPLKYCSSGRYVIAIDKIDCCLSCLKRRKRKIRSWKSHRKTKYRPKNEPKT